MAAYVDGFVLMVPKDKIDEYRKIAQKAGKVWRKYGALDYKECVIDDPEPKGVKRTFAKMAKPKSNEVIIFSFIVFKSRVHRDKVNAKVMKDPYMTDPKNTEAAMPFDMKRMSYAGFKTLVDM